MFDLVIRKMEEKDVEDVWVIEQISFKSPWSKESFENEMKKNNLAYYIIAEVSGEITGYAGAWIFLHEMHITTVAVHPEWRGKKIGKMILLNLFKKAVKQNVKIAILEVREGNFVAQNIYKNFGFQIIGRRRGYYQDGEDAIVMACKDVHSDFFSNKIKEEEVKLNRFFESVKYGEAL